MESLEEVADREEAERQQSLRDLEQLYEWLQQFEDPPPAPRPPPPHQFRNGSFKNSLYLIKYGYQVLLRSIYYYVHTVRKTISEVFNGTKKVFKNKSIFILVYNEDFQLFFSQLIYDIYFFL